MLQKAYGERAGAGLKAEINATMGPMLDKLGDFASFTGVAADIATVLLLGATAFQPELAPVTLPAAAKAQVIGAAADGVALAMEPTNPERAAAVVADGLGGMAGAATSLAIKEGAPAVQKAAAGAAVLATEQVFEGAAEPPIRDVLEKQKK